MIGFERRFTGGRRAAFTLIELLIVMMIIAIAFFALRPAFAGAIRGAQERTMLRGLVGLFTSARTEAIARGRLVKVVFEPMEGAFYAEIQSEPDNDRSIFEPLALVGRSWVVLPEHMAIGKLEVAGRDLAGLGRTHIYFYPDGRTDGLAMLLVDPYGEDMVLEVSPTTGRVRIHV
jgi:prepilin-type N-terminal cleavage/methylation domain-containing protein